jgi:hypothetical protein
MPERRPLDPKLTKQPYKGIQRRRQESKRPRSSVRRHSTRAGGFPRPYKDFPEWGPASELVAGRVQDQLQKEYLARRPEHAPMYEEIPDRRPGWVRDQLQRDEDGRSGFTDRYLRWLNWEPPTRMPIMIGDNATPASRARSVARRRALVTGPAVPPERTEDIYLPPEESGPPWTVPVLMREPTEITPPILSEDNPLLDWLSRGPRRILKGQAQITDPRGEGNRWSPVRDPAALQPYRPTAPIPHPSEWDRRPSRPTPARRRRGRQ